jgi:hypothetical protein
MTCRSTTPTSRSRDDSPTGTHASNASSSTTNSSATTNDGCTSATGDRDEHNGRPDRDAVEIQQWAADHDLPYFDDQVHFPDLRIEYEEIDGQLRHEDVEVVTVHYRGGHAAAVNRSGFSCNAGFTVRLGGSRGGGRGSGHGRRAAEDFWD